MRNRKNKERLRTLQALDHVDRNKILELASRLEILTPNMDFVPPRRGLFRKHTAFELGRIYAALEYFATERFKKNLSQATNHYHVELAMRSVPEMRELASWVNANNRRGRKFLDGFLFESERRSPSDAYPPSSTLGTLVAMHQICDGLASRTFEPRPFERAA